MKSTAIILPLFVFAFIAYKQLPSEGGIISDKTPSSPFFERIVSSTGAYTEIICSMGFEKKLVGVDITSNFPKNIQKLPKIGHQHQLSACLQSSSLFHPLRRCMHSHASQ